METICWRCDRPILHPGQGPSRELHGDLVKVYVVHAGYGCDTGCCGHRAVAEDSQGHECAAQFEFDHPSYSDDFHTWARSFANHAFPGVPLDWEGCEVIDD